MSGLGCEGGVLDELTVAHELRGSLTLHAGEPSMLMEANC